MFAALVKKTLRLVGQKTPIVFRAEFPDGSTYQNQRSEPAVTLRLHNARAERRIALFAHIGLLESFFDGDLDIEGDFHLAFQIGSQSGFDRGQKHPLIALRNRWHEFRYSNADPTQAKANARFHYGLDIEFYRLWLDTSFMMYTCGYWQEGTHTIEQAQANKVEYVCQKVRLKPGEEIIDVGSGFGGFIFHAVENHGVRGTALNTTTEQCDWLREEVRRRGLTDRIAVREADFRDVDRQYDKVISIGVLEHAGRDQLLEVVRAHADFLRPGGLGVLHFIGHVGEFDTEFFIRKHVFPGGWIPGLARTIEAMECCGLEIIDVENLRRHYAHTLDVWAERFDANWDKIHALDPGRYDEHFKRVWRTYLYGCAEMFRSPRSYTHLFQIVFGKGNITDQSYPMSRAFLYRNGTSLDADSLARGHSLIDAC
jgi:cyclopropane-fatty-acyl-phospholipid synthase